MPIAPRNAALLRLQSLCAMLAESEIESAIHSWLLLPAMRFSKINPSLYTKPCATIQMCAIPCSACSALFVAVHVLPGFRVWSAVGAALAGIARKLKGIL
jgi:hypothetical protein